MKIPKQQYTAEFMELAVKRVKNGMTTGVAAKELGLEEQSLWNWVMAAEASTLNGAEATVVTSEQMDVIEGRIRCLADRDRSAENMTQSCDLKTMFTNQCNRLPHNLMYMKPSAL
jgi:transposase